MDKLKKIKKNYSRGMTYVELIVVLSIFSVMTSVVVFNYGGFQAKVDIKNLASDIALKIVEAQKSSVSGELPLRSMPTDWKPSYGVYIDIDNDNKSFFYFTDLGIQDGIFNDTICGGTGECLDKITITKGNIISRLEVFGTGCLGTTVDNLNILFKRPNSGAIISSNPPLSCSSIFYARITIDSPEDSMATINIYPSGRIQIN